MVAQLGHIAIIVPGFAAPPVRHEDLCIYEYQGRAPLGRAQSPLLRPIRLHRILELIP